MVVAYSTDHSFAEKNVPSLRDLKSESWFAFPNDYNQRDAFADNLFAQFHLRGVGSIIWTPVDSLTAQKRMIEAGFGIALLPESSLREEIKLKQLAIVHV